MIIRAPGKLVLTGAYAVLEGARAIVMAVNRYAIANGTLTVRGLRPPTPPEKLDWLHFVPPISIDTSALAAETGKLGLGSSAAAIVAALASKYSRLDPDGRRELFFEAREAHARSQGGGSGVDVAASVFGGLLSYRMNELPRAIEFPRGIHVAAYFSGTSAKTSDMLAKVSAMRDRSAMAALVDAANQAADAWEGGTEVIERTRDFTDALGALGRAAECPIVPVSFATLDRVARDEGAVFLPSGAGGGDSGIFVGTRPPSPSFQEAVHRERMQDLGVGIDAAGVTVLVLDEKIA